MVAGVEHGDPVYTKGPAQPVQGVTVEHQRAGLGNCWIL
jgi:hypothetical protein